MKPPRAPSCCSPADGQALGSEGVLLEYPVVMSRSDRDSFDQRANTDHFKCKVAIAEV